MEEELSASVKEGFHSLNNWLNKITTLSGLAKYQLETKGLDLERLEEERERLIKLLNDLEGYALKIGEILKELRSFVKLK